MILYHTTLRRLLSSILTGGLQVRRHKLRLPAVWLHGPGMLSWGVCHAVQRHGCPAGSVVCVEVSVPRSWVRRGRHKGMYYVLRDVPADRILGVLEWGLMRRR
jgi:hypothetical protein